ncbi:MAG: hypothetical protein V3U92_03675 [Cellulophaga sp.]
MRQIIILLLVYFSIISCNKKEKYENSHINNVKTELEIELSKIDLIVQLVTNSYHKKGNSKYEDILSDSKLSYDIMTRLLYQVIIGKLSYTKFTQDVNNAFDKESMYKTGLAKEISLYYKYKYYDTISKRVISFENIIKPSGSFPLAPIKTKRNGSN